MQVHPLDRELYTDKSLAALVGNGRCAVGCAHRYKCGLGGKFYSKVFEVKYDRAQYPELGSFWWHISTELPAFIHHLVHAHEISSESTCPDYGVISYHNADIVAALEQESPEKQLAELIDRHLFSNGQTSWRGTASQVIAALSVLASLELDPSYRNPQKVGRFLTALVAKNPKRFRSVGSVHGYTTYEIQAPTLVAITAIQ